jgi:hypothetical protein
MMELIALVGAMAVAEWLMPYKAVHGAWPWIRLQSLRLGLGMLFLIVAHLINGATLSVFWVVVVVVVALAALVVASGKRWG